MNSLSRVVEWSRFWSFPIVVVNLQGTYCRDPNLKAFARRTEHYAAILQMQACKRASVQSTE